LAVIVVLVIATKRSLAHFGANLSRDIAFPAVLERSSDTMSIPVNAPPCRADAAPERHLKGHLPRNICAKKRNARSVYTIMLKRMMDQEMND